MNAKKNAKPKYNMWQNTAWMIGIAWREHKRRVLIFMPLAALLTAAMDFQEMILVPTFLDAVEHNVPIGELCKLIVFFTAAMIIFRIVSRYVFQNSFDARSSVRDIIIGKYVEKTLTTAYPNISQERFVKLLSVAGVNTFTDNRAAAAIWKKLAELLGNAVDVLVCLWLFDAKYPILLVVIAVTSILSCIVTSHMEGFLYRHQDEQLESSRRMRYSLDAANDRQAVKDMRLFGLHPWLVELSEQAVSVYETFLGRVFDRRLVARIVTLLLTLLRNGIAYVLLMRQVLAGGMETSEFLLMFTAVGYFADRISGIMENSEKLHRSSIDLNRMRELLEYPEPFCYEEGKALALERTQGCEIRLEHVSFQYPGSEKKVLDDINLTLHHGEKIAIVGLSGAGKSTLVKLLCGLLDPTEGRVLLDECDIREYNRRDYYRLFAAVFQNYVILPGSVALNVAQSVENIDMQRVRDCVEKAGLREKIESLPAGYDTKLNNLVYDDAIELAGGEAQRLMLARALYKNTPILVLDEPTSALDPIAESEIYRKYSRMTAEKSSVYVSHRLASTRFCDRILLIENGRIAESGTHEELVARGGKYAGLFEVQRRYYQGGEEGNA